MKFKEWFKNEKSEKEAKPLEKLARARLRGQSTPHLDALGDPELQADLLMQHPKTNDDTRADDFAEHIIINPEVLEEPENPQDDPDFVIDDVLIRLYHQVRREHDYLMSKKSDIEAMKGKSFGLAKKIEAFQQMTNNHQKMAFATQDEFHEYQVSEKENELKALKIEEERLEKKIESEEADFQETKKKYEEALKRYQALRDQLEPDEQEEVESKN